MDSARSTSISLTGSAEFLESQTTRLLGVALVLTESRPDAEDLTQDALLQIHRRWQRVSEADHPGAYARRVLVNEFLSQRRRRSLATVALADIDVPTPAGDSEVDRRDYVMWALKQLSPRQRTVIVLRHYEQLDATEIAVVLGIEVSTVRTAHCRGIATLRRLLSHDDTADRESDHVIRR